MAEKMRAVAITGINKAEIIPMDRPVPEKGQILIRIRACALCTWEQRVFYGEKKVPLPLVGGHEVAGEILALGEGVDPARFPIGAKAAGRIVKSCQSCYYCRRGYPTQCVELNTLRLNGPDVFGMGGLAEYICLDSSAVWVLENNHPYPILALTEPLACVLNSVEQAKPRMGDDAVIIGGGIMGQLHVIVLKKMGMRTILSEPDAQRRVFALENGCDIVIDPMAEDPVSRVKELTGGRGAEVVINTTPIPKIQEQAIAMLGKLGRCVVYSSQHPDQPIPISPNWLHNSEAIITGAVNPSIKSFDQAVNVINKGLLDVSSLVSAVFPMEKAQEAFEAALRPDTFRVVITMD